MRRKESSLLGAILYSIIGISILGLILVSILSGMSMENFIGFTMERVNQTAVDLLIPQVNHYFEHHENVTRSLKRMYEDELETTGDGPPLSSLLNLITSDYVKRVERIDEKGIIQDTYPYDSNLIGIDISGRSYDYVNDSDNIYRTMTFVDPVLREAVMAYEVNLFDGGRLVVYPDLDTIQAFLSRIELTGDSRIGIVDPKGVFVAHNINSYRTERFTDPLYLKWAEDNSSINDEQMIDDEKFIVKISSIDSDGWALIVYQSLEDLRRDTFQYLTQIGIGFVVVATLLVFLGLRIYIRISNDIKHLMTGVTALESNIGFELKEDFRYKETGEVYRKLSATGTELIVRENEIKDLNQELEQRVQDRTMELEAMNEELIATIDELQETQDLLVEARKMSEIGRVVSGVAHEMNTPLGNALTLSTFLQVNIKDNGRQLLDGKLSRSEAGDWLSEVLESIRLQEKAIMKSADLIQEFKRLDVNRSVELDWINILVLIGVVKASFSSQIKRLNIEIMVDVEKVEVYADPLILREVISLLIDNVLLHAYDQNEKKLIQIKGYMDSDEYVLEVSDYGKGMSEQSLELAFRAFEAGERKNGHTGLGLFIVGSYVRNLLLGDVKCKSELGRGTSIQVRLKKIRLIEKSTNSNVQ